MGGRLGGGAVVDGSGAGVSAAGGGAGPPTAPLDPDAPRLPAFHGCRLHLPFSGLQDQLDWIQG